MASSVADSDAASDAASLAVAAVSVESLELQPASARAATVRTAPAIFKLVLNVSPRIRPDLVNRVVNPNIHSGRSTNLTALVG